MYEAEGVRFYLSKIWQKVYILPVCDPSMLLSNSFLSFNLYFTIHDFTDYSNIVSIRNQAFFIIYIMYVI